MVPIGALIGIALLLGKLGGAGNGSGSGGFGSNRREIFGREIAMVAGVTKAASWVGAFLSTKIAFEPSLSFSHRTLGALLFALCIIYNFPFVVISQTFIRLGWVRAAYRASWILSEDWQHKGTAGAALLSAVRAARRAKKLDIEGPIGQWLRQTLRARYPQADYNTLVAVALFESRTNQELTRGLLTSAERMPRRSGRDCVRNIARQWLVADAFIDETYEMVPFLAARATFWSDPRTFAIAAEVKLRIFQLRPRLAEKVALIVFRPPKATRNKPPELKAAATLGDGLRNLIWLSVLPADGAAVVRCVRDWERLFEQDALLTHLRTRLAVLGGHADAEELRRDFLGNVGGILVAIAVQNRVALENLGLPDDFVGTCLQAHCQRYEERLRDLVTRVEAGQALNRIEEGAQAGAIVRAYTQACVGVEVRNALYRISTEALCSYGVQLDRHGDIAFRAFAHALFQHLLSEAIVAEDEANVDLMYRNCDVTT
jgi:hypothetical protein